AADWGSHASPTRRSSDLEHGSISSAFALANPLSPEMAVDHAPFLDVPFMAATITDSHYDNPDRRGRHFAFLARMVQQGDSVAFRSEEHTSELQSRENLVC